MASDYRKIINDINYLNNRYGNGFGFKVFLIVGTVSVIFCLCLIGYTELRKSKDSNKMFILDNDKKCIIYTMPRAGIVYYYEVDFEKGKIVKRFDEQHKREELGKKDIESDSLEILVNKVTNDENNLNFLDSEKIELYRKNLYTFYYIKTYTGDIFYVKQQEPIEELNELLKM